jgi:hypothetical protein
VRGVPQPVPGDFEVMPAVPGAVVYAEPVGDRALPLASALGDDLVQLVAYGVEPCRLPPQRFGQLEQFLR